MTYRKEYANDPDAPKATSIVPAASAIVESRLGILMHRRRDSEVWALPGGAIEPGESVTQGLRREVLEETGLLVTFGGLVGIYSDPGYVVAYEDGEVRQQFSICMNASTAETDTRLSDESLAIEWVTRERVLDRDMGPGTRRRIEDYLLGLTDPVID